MSNKKNTETVNWAALRRNVGLTLAELSEKSGYSVATINGLELKDEGSKRLRAKLHEILLQSATHDHLKVAAAFATQMGGTQAERQATFEQAVEETTRWMKRAMNGAEKLRATAKKLREEAEKLEAAADEMQP
jgi:transcriptional regulator with XRE-family HTH domain